MVPAKDRRDSWNKVLFAALPHNYRYKPDCRTVKLEPV